MSKFSHLTVFSYFTLFHITSQRPPPRSLDIRAAESSCAGAATGAGAAYGIKKAGVCMAAADGSASSPPPPPSNASSPDGAAATGPKPPPPPPPPSKAAKSSPAGAAGYCAA